MYIPATDIFQSTPSTQRETLLVCALRQFNSFQSTPSTQRETIPPGYTVEDFIEISIHSLYAEGDNYCVSDKTDFAISIHSLYAEGDTPRRAARKFDNISIHSLYAEGDAEYAIRKWLLEQFQSTPSTQRETAVVEWIS